MDNKKIESQQIKLPTGGGAISAIGETFQPNAFNGTGSFSLPIPVSPARGFEPKLSLNYNSGAGNGTFGLGFSLNLANVSIRTEKGLPKYDGTDIYLLNGEELVPKFDGQSANENYTVTQYLPRVEGAFSLIEHYQKQDNSTSYWKITSADNITTIYGNSTASQIYDLNNLSHVFEWLIARAEDAKGNKINYYYSSEDEEGIEDNSVETKRALSNKYIKTIQYGNYILDGEPEKYAFELVFDYGQHQLSNLAQGGSDPYQASQRWPYRHDAFSSYKSTFEIRTRRLCRNILVFHHFEKELGQPCLVKSLSFEYQQTQHSQLSLMNSAVLIGYKRAGKAATDKYKIQKMPATEFKFSQFNVADTPAFEQLKVNDKDIPGHLNQSGFQPSDLNGEGIAGLLYSNQTSLLYLEPEGCGTYGVPAAPAQFPVDRDFQAGQSNLVDLDGNGQLALVVNNGNRTGFYQRKDNALQQSPIWENYQPFEKYPNDHTNPNMEMAGLSQNGKTDLLLVDEAELRIYPSKGKKGYGASTTVARVADFPLIKKGYLKEHVAFTNLFGDGLPHRVRITQNGVECWPALGYGKFGNKIALSSAPEFGDDFDATRLFLADIDGSGTTDLIYVQADQISLYINKNGNGFSDAITVNLPEPFSTIDQISFADILGNGTTCLVFSKMALSPVHYYYNFVGETCLDGVTQPSMKPYLLNEIDNNMGAVSQMQYCSATKFYLQDKKSGTPWRTQLPFPVQVVEKSISIDKITGLRLTKRFAYHDGYYDHSEKEFRGFGFVETWDTETLGKFQAAGKQNECQSTNEKYYMPPVYTKTWHSTGAVQQSNSYKNARYTLGAYFNGDERAYNDFPESLLPQDLDDASSRQAYAALKGTVIRTEVYADDKKQNPALFDQPYQVDETSVEVSVFQKKGEHEYAVFMLTPRESISYHYERDAQDPKIQQNFTLAKDTFGNPLTTCSISLPRRDNANIQNDIYPEQQTLKATVNLQKYITPQKGSLYCHLSCEQQQLELFNLEIDGQYCSYDELKNKVNALNLQQQSNITPYDAQVSVEELQARQLTWQRTYFWNDNVTEGLSLGDINALGLEHHHEEAVFTQEFIDDVFTNRLTEDTLTSLGGYVFDQNSGYWWNKGLVQSYDKNKFYQPSKSENTFVKPSSSLYALKTLSYDDYSLFVTETQQYIDATNSLITQVTYNYRCAQISQLIDPNNNISQALFDPLGQVIVTSLIGTENGTNSGGMTLYEDGTAEAEYQQKSIPTFDQVISNPQDYLQGANSFFYYNLHAWTESQQPLSSINLVRNSFYHASQSDNAPYCQMVVTYSDGYGHPLATKHKVDPGLAFIREATGKLKVKNNQVLQIPAESRWQVTGRTVYNNKGKAVEQYLPYFIDTPAYEDQQDIPSPPPTQIYYDPLGRVIKTVSPKGFFSKVEFSPWQESHFDENDTVVDSDYFQQFMATYPVAPSKPAQQQKDEKDALDKAAALYNTPEIKVLDNLGFVIRDIQYKAQDEQLVAYEANDIQGRTVTSIDPRLYQSNTVSDTDCFNFKYRYAMGQKDPIYIDSIDAGIEKHLSNIYGKQLLSLSARNYCQLINYDRLQRQTELKVKKLLGVKIIDSFTTFNVVEQFFYEDHLLEQGKTKTQLQDSNLWGALYQLNDLSGTVINSQYSLQGEVLHTSRQMVEDYKNAADWNQQVALEDDIYSSLLTYNAIKQLITETTPDASTVTNNYNQAGQLKSVALTFKDGTHQQIIKQIEYDANGQRTLLHYGNGIKTQFQYEASTLHLLSIKNSQQDLQYSYDPVGNITRLRDNTYATVFHNNQQVTPLSDYRFDALYRLTAASGRQHPGLNAGTLKQADFIQLAGANESSSLEHYNECYTYDDSGNLIEKKHNAASNTWAKQTPVELNCNHLQDLNYDASGNLRKVITDSTLQLSFNCCENLIKANIVQRQGSADDCEYYLYDSHEQRTRKVSELMVNNGKLNQIEDKIYFGNYEVKRNKTIDTNETIKITLQRQTLKVMAGDTCIAIVHSWDIDNNQKESQNLNARKIRYQLDNHLGSVALELDDQAQLISYEEYFPYGGTALRAGKNLIEVALKEYRYSGKERDNCTGFYYYGRRYYAPGLGRWLNPDPAHRVDGMNLYAFVGGNPITFSDDKGLAKTNYQILTRQPDPSSSNFKYNKKTHKSDLVDSKKGSRIAFSDNKGLSKAKTNYEIISLQPAPNYSFIKDFLNPAKGFIKDNLKPLTGMSVLLERKGASMAGPLQMVVGYVGSEKYVDKHPILALGYSFLLAEGLTRTMKFDHKTTARLGVVADGIKSLVSFNHGGYFHAFMYSGLTAVNAVEASSVAKGLHKYIGKSQLMIGSGLIACEVANKVFTEKKLKH